MTTPPYTPPPAQPTYAPPPATAPPPQKSGCLKWALIGCSVIVVLIVAFVAVVMLVVFGAIKRSDVYKGAVERVKNDPRAIAALGSPIDAGIWVKGSIRLENGGNADVTFPVKGPNQRGMVHAVATIVEGKWQYETLTLQPENGALIDLLSGAPPPG
jgi:hypothetical protein